MRKIHLFKMKNIMQKISTIILLAGIYAFACKPDVKKETSYNVERLSQIMVIDANWDKPQWQNTKALEISNYMGTIPEFQPQVKAKMMYDEENIYVIFQVKDRYVRCLTTEYNGPVYKDSAVEFFFSPDSSQPLLYFNLETNCGGTALMQYNLVPRKESTAIDTNDIKLIEMAHSLPRIPLAMLEKYSLITHPEKGIIWRANFYKIAENNSNPHYITWAVVDNSYPDFHLPKYFGKLLFQ
jgi:hypothetical protein